MHAYMSGGSLVESEVAETILDLTAVNLEYPLTPERVHEDFEDINFALRQRTHGRRFRYDLKWSHLTGDELREVRGLLAYVDYGDQRNLFGVGQWKVIDIQPVHSAVPPAPWVIREQNTFQKYFPPISDVTIEDKFQIANLKNKYIQYYENVELTVLSRELSNLGSGGYTPDFEIGGIA